MSRLLSTGARSTDSSTAGAVFVERRFRSEERFGVVALFGAFDGCFDRDVGITTIVRWWQP
jgi:hypothetical protein